MTPVIHRVREGLRTPTAGRPAVDRIFSIIAAGVGEDLGPVARAADPDTGLRLPDEGSPHPDDAELVCVDRCIFPVGLKERGGAMLAARTGLFNVRCRYVRRTPGQVQPSQQAALGALPADREQADASGAQP